MAAKALLSPPSSVLQILRNRQLISAMTSIDDTVTYSFGSSVYLGFDPTGDSLHLGHLLTIMPLIHFQQHGYQPIAVIGGATVLVGDPSGRFTERNRINNTDSIEHNMICISNTLSKIFSNALKLVSSTPAQPVLKILNNYDWYRDVNLIDFLSDFGRHFRMGTMLKRESVQGRLQSEGGLSFTEFTYQILQAYDFMYLNKHHQTWLQLGGADQWGNIVSGCELIHKLTESQVHGLTVPLLTTSSGQKLGKTDDNTTVWLSPNRTSPYQLYQYLLNTSDSDVELFLQYLTFTSLEDITTIMEQQKSSPEKRPAQLHLAQQVTLLVHGENGMEQAINATKVLFGEDSQLINEIPKSEIEDIFSDVPSSQLSYSLITETTKITDVLSWTSAVPSKGEAMRLIKTGGVYINQKRITSPTGKWSHDEHVIHNNLTIVRIGKKLYHLIKWTS